MSVHTTRGETLSSRDAGHQSRAADVALCRLAGQGDAAARRELADRVAQRVRTTVCLLSGCRADAQDLAQLCLIQIIRSAASYSGQGRLESWVDRIVVRTSMRALTAPHRKLEVLSAEPPELAVPGDLEGEVASRQIFVHLVNLLQKLKPDQRMVATLCLIHEYRLSEVAEITGMPFNTVRDHLRVGRKELRKRIIHDPVLADWVKARKR